MIQRNGQFFVWSRGEELVTDKFPELQQLLPTAKFDPAEIENALMSHPDVVGAAAIGQPDSFAGALPCVYVQLREGGTATEAELADLMFAWTVAKHVKSNAIVYARDRATVGIGAGQMSRVDSTRIGRRKSEDMAQALGLPAPLSEGAAVASDAFFPFADGIEALAEAGARAVIQPGGSMRDAEVIAAADRLGLAMVFTGQRHFRH